MSGSQVHQEQPVARKEGHPGQAVDWLKEYEDDLAELQAAEFEFFPVDMTDQQAVDRLLEEYRKLYEPLLDGSLDPGELDIMRAAYWQRFGAMEIARAKRETAIKRRLAPLYERLSEASEEVWQEYARMKIRIRFDSVGKAVQMMPWSGHG